LAQAPQRPIPQPNSFSALGPTSLTPRPTSPRPNSLPHAAAQRLTPRVASLPAHPDPHVDARRAPAPVSLRPGPACHPSPSAYLAAQQSPAAIPAALPSLLPRRDPRPLPFKHPADPCAPPIHPRRPQNPSSSRRYPELEAEPPAAAGELFLSRFLAAGLTLATLTPWFASQRHQSSIRAAQEPGGAPHHPVHGHRTDSAAEPRRRPICATSPATRSPVSTRAPLQFLLR
jgi:hypothetical protein